MKILRISTFNEKPYLILTFFYVHRWKMIDETSTKSIFDKVSHQLSSWDLFKFFMEILKTLFLAKDSLRKFLQVICFLNTWGLRAIFLHVTDLIFKRWWKINETIITAAFSFNSYMDCICFFFHEIRKYKIRRNDLIHIIICFLPYLYWIQSTMYVYEYMFL
jgi:hypothetical protein